MGRKKKKDPPPAKPRVEGEESQGPKKVAEASGGKTVKKPTGSTSAELAALYGDEKVGVVGPTLRKGDEKKEVETSNFNQEAAAKVFADNAASFQGCVEAELKKNPNAKLGKLILAVTVAPSGIVTKAVVDKKEVDRSGLGDCLRLRAKRMRFNAFEGEPTDVEIPIFAGAAY